MENNFQKDGMWKVKNHSLAKEGEKASGPFFSLNETEWSKCVAKYPSILEFRGVNYIERTCTGSIQPGQENYFSSETVINQFERLFQILQFKIDFNSPVRCRGPPNLTLI